MYGKAGRVCRGGVSSYWNMKFTKRSYTRGFNYQFLRELKTVKDLKIEMESVKWENKRILRAQEELNQILTEKFQTEGRGRRTESEDTSHQRKSKKIKHTKDESSSTSEVFGEQWNYHSTSDSSDDN